MKSLSKNKFNIINFSAYKEIHGQFTDEFIKSAGAVKIDETDNCILIAIRNIGENQTKNTLCQAFQNKKIDFVPVSDTDYEEFIGKFVEKESRKQETQISEESVKFDAGDVSDSSVINIINSIFLEAVRQKASDIHIQPEESVVKIRYRIDGVLRTMRELPRNISKSLVSRLKVMANMNIMETRLPQDGHIEINANGKKIDARFSSIPVQHGECIVLRLFNNDADLPSLNTLGFSPDNLTKIQKALSYPNGIILLTGPTGSGKTTTLHSILETLDKESLNIVTIEDPVERKIRGISQIQVNAEIGLTFESILRRVLRQDPDVIMVGEIRDSETAQLALRAALTGHLLFATLHTNSSTSAPARLANMGLDPYLISQILRISVAQRLVRKPCPKCCTEVIPDYEFTTACKKYGIKIPLKIIEAKGCKECGFSGFYGRTVISEIFVPNERSRKQIVDEKSIKLENAESLAADGILKVAQGETTVSELKREGVFIL
jgi:type II secretory ATPase GspE/PulE/Tfp pilus assembly ATPase PilB-like protein